jgi:prevent-host-death family protein
VAVRDLKDNLSRYLRKVEAGETVVVTSHGRALADLVPHRDDRLPEATLPVREPTRPWGSVKLAHSGRGSTDSVALLLEERRRR